MRAPCRSGEVFDSIISREVNRADGRPVAGTVFTLIHDRWPALRVR
jgi:hypothetical protein